jgi:hypothetical protein
MNPRRLVTLTSFVTMCLGALLGCSSPTTIDGQRVAKLGSDAGAPSCPAICRRLRQLCGYAPVECTAPDAAGYCELNFDEERRSCMGTAADCQSAWSCANAAPPPDAAPEMDAESTDDGAARADGESEAQTDAVSD